MLNKVEVKLLKQAWKVKTLKNEKQTTRSHLH